MKCVIKIITIGIMAFTAGTVNILYGESMKDDMINAYSQMKYKKAYKLSEKQSSTPASRLIKALCLVHDTGVRDIKAGLKILNKLYKDSLLPKKVWLEAALAYGRVVQLMQQRLAIYPQSAGIDSEKIYNEILKKYPDSEEASEALIYSSTYSLASGNNSKIDKTLDKIELFCQQFKGVPNNLVPVHLFADFQYIARRRNYKMAVKHLCAAQTLGILSPQLKEIVLFRIGRIYDKKLNNHIKALIYYRKYLQVYPESVYSPIVKRYIKELKQ